MAPFHNRTFRTFYLVKPKLKTYPQLVSANITSAAVTNMTFTLSNSYY